MSARRRHATLAGLLALAAVLARATAAHAAPGDPPSATPPPAAAPQDLGEADALAAGAVVLPPDPEAPTVGASLDRTEASVGDHLTLTVSAVGKAAVAATVRLPDPLELGPFEVLESTHVDRDLGDGKFSRRFVLVVSAYDTGALELPGIDLSYESAAGHHRAVSTGPIPVSVKSVVGDDPAAQPQPLRPTRSVLVEDQRIWSILRWAGVGGGVLLALAIALLLVRRARRRPTVAPAIAVVPPHLVALRRLDDLRARGEFGLHGYRTFYFELAEILRAYLGARFAFDALELTTTELLGALDRHGAPRLDGRVERFLEACDLVKFARFPSSDAEANRWLAEAEQLVEALREPVPAVAPEAPPPPVASRGEEASGG